MNENLRPIAPIGISGLTPRAPETGMPICEMVEPQSLFVDPAYQRNVGEKGHRQIRRIIERFDWAKFKPPICAYAEVDGATVLKVLDGQHTAIAAASHPMISHIPVVITEAVGTVAQAEAFIGHNTDRLGVTVLQLHQAALTAGNEDALTLELVCKRAGVTVLAQPPGRQPPPRQTTAISTIKAVINKHGVIRAREVLEVLANAEMGPLTAPQIKAVELLLTDIQYAERIAPEELTNAIVDMLFTAEDEAKLFAAAHKVPLWKALAVTWFQKCRKLRQPRRLAG